MCKNIIDLYKKYVHMNRACFSTNTICSLFTPYESIKYITCTVLLSLFNLYTLSLQKTLPMLKTKRGKTDKYDTDDT